ncbi:MAG: hypothetical protein H7Z12_01255 [Rhodospirillaceae bacterium]|nr:hypothetical protein [Rhodospirillales bacterium]
MMYSACTPAAAPLEVRGAAQPAFAVGLRARSGRDFEGNGEPSLDELMGDEVIRRVMARDGVQADQLRSLMDHMRNRLR